MRPEATLHETQRSEASYYSSQPGRLLSSVTMTATLLSSPTSSAPLKREDSFDLLCACATVNPGPEQIARIVKQDGNAAVFDWQEFLRLAEHHGVLPLIARNLITHARGLPPDIEQSLQSAYTANLRRSMWFAAELLRITRYFEQRGLRTLPYKGPVLAQSAYGDLGLRSFSDLDLLVSPADFTHAKQALAELGYRPSQELAPAVERLWLRTGYERSFDGAAGKNLVELQWNLLPHFYAVDAGVAEFQFDDLRKRAGRITFGVTQAPSNAEANAQPRVPTAVQTDVPCLSPEDSLLVLCLHAAKHLWTRLIWVSDIAESLRMPGIDLALVASRARTLGTSRILGVSYWLTEHLLGVATPTSARSLVGDDPDVPVIGRECAARLARAATYDFDSTEYFRQFLKLRERPGDRRRYLWRLVSTPGPGDIAAVALPEIIFPLYRVVRVGRLLRKLIGKIEP